MAHKAKVIIWDLDGTIIDSAHRTPNKEDGTLDLEGYIKNHTRNNVMNDRLLPLANIMKQRRELGDMTIILTARELHDCDYEYLLKHGITADKILSRNNISEKHYQLKDGEYKKRHIIPLLNLKQFQGRDIVMFDDASPVKSALRKHFPVLCAIKTNDRLKKNRLASKQVKA